MSAESYQIYHKNVEDGIFTTTILDSEGTEPSELLEGAENPAIMETPSLDDDKTEPIRSKRLKIGFNSGDRGENIGIRDVGDFSDGSDDRFQVSTLLFASVPFVGNLSLDDNSEAFQPQPNPVQLVAVDGLNSLSNIEITESDGDVLIGHFRIIDYLRLCLDKLYPNQYIYVVFNLYEEDTDPLTSHAFWDTFLDALTFETDIDKRDDCLTVLKKILDSLGCFLCYDQAGEEYRGWWVIRWHEYDAKGTSILTHRTAKFDTDGSFMEYLLVDLTKIIASDYDVLYEGIHLSQDNAQRRFQGKAKEVIHQWRHELPKDIPCNSQFSRGDVLTQQSGFNTYELDSWTTGVDFPTGGSQTADAYIRRNKDANNYEKDRFVVLEPEVSTSEMYIESCGVGVNIRDRFTLSFKWAFSADVSDTGSYTRRLGIVRIEGDDGTYWTLDENGKWFQSNVTWTVNLKVLQQTIDTANNETEFIDFSIEAEEIPADGTLYIMFLSESQDRYNVDVYINDLEFDYETRIASGYPGSRRPTRPFLEIQSADVNGQQVKVSDGVGRKSIEKQMYLSDSSKKLFKGALKKFDGVNYVLTGNWQDFIDATLDPNRLSWFIVFQWWNQFRKTRTVIETDLQGITSTGLDSLPGLIHRYKINHADEGDKYFMLTRLGFMDFKTCGWNGVFVETSDMDGDRDYTDDFEFKYIQ